MSQPRVLIDQKSHRSTLPGAPHQGWRLVGMFSWVMVAAGLGDTVLAFIPMRFGVPEWEFGTTASVFSALPLISMGLAGLLASALATGRRAAILWISWGLILLSIAVLAMYLVFLSDAPVALAQVQGEIRLGIIKAITKTSWLGLIFGVAYLVGGIAGLRYLRKSAS